MEQHTKKTYHEAKSYQEMIKSYRYMFSQTLNFIQG